MFHTPTVRNKGKIVYVECLSRESIAETFLNDDVGTSESEQGLEAVVDIGAEGSGPSHKTQATLIEIYKVGLTFRNIWHGCTSAWYENWPPLASNFTGENVKLVSPQYCVSIQFYYVVCWVF